MLILKFVPSLIPNVVEKKTFERLYQALKKNIENFKMV